LVVAEEINSGLEVLDPSMLGLPADASQHEWSRIDALIERLDVDNLAELINRLNAERRRATLAAVDRPVIDVVREFQVNAETLRTVAVDEQWRHRMEIAQLALESLSTLKLKMEDAFRHDLGVEAWSIDEGDSRV
jgi:hypothetical protein